MSYISQEIKQGIKLHCIDTDKFKTNLMAVIITLPLNREKVTFNTVIPAVLKRGTEKLKTQEDIAKKLENMYGASFDCGIEKIGDNHVIKFYLESLNDQFIPKIDVGAGVPDSPQKILKQSIDLLLDIIFNPYLENNRFKNEYVEAEKNNIKILIESKIDNKDQYALNRCIEEMYKDKPYGLYKYGYIEDLEKINSENLYNYYLELINTCKIDILVSGDLNKEEIKNILKDSENIKKLKERNPNYIVNNEQTEDKESVQEKEIEEKMDIGQGKLVIGLDVELKDYNSKFPVSMYNVILGESATSKLFQNVREKASLAYTTKSNYVRQKNNIYIRCGIEIENYEKALKIIKEQLEDMKNGGFTEEDLRNAKKYMISGLESVQDEQDSEITYYIGQELSGKLTTFEEYIEQVNKVSIEDVKKVANNININTIYFLRN
ncbi:MAG: insulinase family protein [Clostridia bacterium]|nr:insulinase family protein [Clostridia bacterium]